MHHVRPDKGPAVNGPMHPDPRVHDPKVLDPQVHDPTVPDPKVGPVMPAAARPPVGLDIATSRKRGTMVPARGEKRHRTMAHPAKNRAGSPAAPHPAPHAGNFSPVQRGMGRHSASQARHSVSGILKDRGIRRFAERHGLAVRPSTQSPPRWPIPARRLRRLLLTEEAEAAIGKQLPPPWAVSPERVDRARLDHLLGRDIVHQGAALLADPLAPPSLQSVLEKPGVIIVLDQVTDPRNVGAIMRSAAAFGAAAVITQDRNAPEETGGLAKAASGALEKMPLLRAVNIARTIIALKAAQCLVHRPGCRRHGAVGSRVRGPPGGPGAGRRG